MGSIVQPPFSADKFLSDLEQICSVVGAPYSEEKTKQVLATYADKFYSGPVHLRATSRPGDAVNYRVYETENLDSLYRAIDAGLLDPQNPMLGIYNSWRSLFNGDSLSLYDFDAGKGLSKSWIFLNKLRPLDDILEATNVPDSIRSHRKTFHSHKLSDLSFVAVDFCSRTVNLYFVVHGPLKHQQATHLVALAGAPPISPKEFQQMSKFIDAPLFTFAVTIDHSTGNIKRCAFYALLLETNNLPVLDPQLSAFFTKSPSYDQRDFNIVGWSFGKGGATYTKGEKGYSGETRDFAEKAARLFPGSV